MYSISIKEKNIDWIGLILLAIPYTQFNAWKESTVWSGRCPFLVNGEILPAIERGTLGEEVWGGGCPNKL